MKAERKSSKPAANHPWRKTPEGWLKRDAAPTPRQAMLVGVCHLRRGKGPC